MITGQLGLTGAEFCHFAVWTEVDIHIEWIFLDVALWTNMKTRLRDFYYTTMGIEVLDRLCNVIHSHDINNYSNNKNTNNNTEKH